MSKHFTVGRFSAYPVEWADRWQELATMLDRIREAWGKPIRVVSGYRTPSWVFVVHRTSPADKGIAINLCPWCGESWRPDLKRRAA